jgi:glycosyltransferase involved in cell wall biosynthesis
MTPKISVILPVFNAQTYLQESIESILSQTFTNFELIIINDGSTDQSLDIIQSYSDERIKLINQANAGLPISLNRAIAIAKGQYLARQDADDISLPSRLAEQAAYLDEHPACALLGSWANILMDNSPTDRALQHPHLNGDIALKLLFFNCFVHSSVMIRKSALEKSGLYPEERDKFPPEDYDLWLRISKSFEVANIPKALLQYRELPNSISRTKLQIMQERAELMSLNAIKDILGPSFTDADIADLIKGMTSQTLPTNQIKRRLHVQMLDALAEHKKKMFTQSSQSVAEIELSLIDCQAILARSYQKSKIYQWASYLPFDMIPLLKRIKNQWQR